MQTNDPAEDVDMPGANADAALNREIQAKIGQKLRAMYEDIVQQGVPDRFVELLRKLDKPTDQ
jgi:hypothetical protein